MTITLDIDDNLLEQAEAVAEATGWTLAKVIENAVGEYLELYSRYLGVEPPRS